MGQGCKLEIIGVTKVRIIKACKSYLVKTPRGYRFEMFIPAERLNGWNEVAEGKDIGFGFYLTVMDLKDSQHLLYWPNPKADNIMKKPWMWARVRLEK